MRFERITKKMVLFVNLLGKGLTQEINRDGGSLMGSLRELILHETNVDEEGVPSKRFVNVYNFCAQI